MTSRIIWSREADDDLLQILSYLASEASIVRADNQIYTIERACLRLADWPLSGRSRDSIIPGMRSIVAAPHVIFYRVLEDSIQIIRVLHGHRDFEAVFTGES
jgi:toxin ParE1/3/4